MRILITRANAALLLATGLVLAYVPAYLYAMTRIDWLEILSPRGGIVTYCSYLMMALGLIVAGRSQYVTARERFERTLAGWVLLAMPPLWFLLSI